VRRQSEAATALWLNPRSPSKPERRRTSFAAALQRFRAALYPFIQSCAQASLTNHVHHAKISVTAKAYVCGTIQLAWCDDCFAGDVTRGRRLRDDFFTNRRCI
jgi:hypothetical protein